MNFPLVYEVNARCWLREVSQRAGTKVRLGAVPDAELEPWLDGRFTHLWLMGVWEAGPRSRAEAVGNPDLIRRARAALPDFRDQDLGGSPYAIAGYHVARELGGEAGLAAFRRQLRQRGLQLILDFIPNHVGLDHPWATTAPERFVCAAPGTPGAFKSANTPGAPWLLHGRDPSFPPWTDTAQLDLRRSDTRAALLEEMLAVADRCDGLRCDMAMLLLNDVLARSWGALPASAPQFVTEFWTEAVAALRARYPAHLLLAEAYWGLEAELQRLGFDYTYDKQLYDALIARDSAGLCADLLGHSPEFVARSAHFLENHDEPRIASLLSLPEHRAAALLLLGLPGLRLLHEGQLTGARVQLPVHLTRRPVELVQPALETLYHHLLGALDGTAVGQGEATLLTPKAAWNDNPSGRSFVLVQWQRTRPEFDLVVVNLAPHRGQCYAPLTAPGLAKFNWRLEDLLGDEAHQRDGEDLKNRGLYLDVPAYNAQLFHFKPV
jgi:hypothetical protein